MCSFLLGQGTGAKYVHRVFRQEELKSAWWKSLTPCDSLLALFNPREGVLGSSREVVCDSRRLGWGYRKLLRRKCRFGAWLDLPAAAIVNVDAYQQRELS